MSVIGPNDAETALLEMLSLSPVLQRTVIRPMESFESGGITTTQRRALFALAIHDRLPMGVLAKELDISKQQLTKIVAALAQKGYIERFADSKNRRVMLVQLSPSGAALADSALAAAASALLPYFEDFSDQDKTTLFHSARAIKDILERLEAARQ